MKNKNAIFVVSVGDDSKIKYSLPTFNSYAEKVNADVVLIKDSKYNLKNTYSGNYNYLTFEKNQIFYHFDDYERILRLDSDIIITPNAPNYFELDPSFLYVSREDVGSRALNRWNEIATIKRALGDIPDWDKFYYNSGVMLASYIHKHAFDISDVDFNKHLGQFKEQNVVNWKTNYHNFKLKDLGKNFNYTAAQEGFSTDSRLKAGIIHYAGNQRIKNQKMESDFNKLYS